MDFETRPVSELPPRRRTTATGFAAAFAELPTGLALFNPAKPGVRARNAGGGIGHIRKIFPNRRIFTRTDEQKHGMWIWWVEKEPDA